MRRLITVLSTVALAFGLTLVAAEASITSPAVNAVLRGNATLAETGGYDDSSLNHCGLAGLGDDGSTTLQLINSANQVKFEQHWEGEGARSVTIDTHNYPNGAYTVRGIIEIRKNSGFGGLGCKTDTVTSNRAVTIDNISEITYTGATSGVATTSVTVSAKLIDPNRNPQELSGKVISFALSGGSTVSATTNSSGIASTSMPIGGAPRTATLTTSFAGDTFFKASSKATTFTVNKQDTATTVDPPADVVHGQPASYVAHVAVTQGTGTVGNGTVQFKQDGTNIGSAVAVSGGVATSPSISTLTTGDHDITAVYSGSTSYENSTSAPVTQTVTKADTTTSVTQNINPTVHGQSVTFTATVGVVSPGNGTITGDVQFTIDGQPKGAARPLTGNQATLQVSDLAAGNHDVVATYNGNGDLKKSDSAAIVHGVDQAQTQVALTSSDPSAVAGQPLTFTAQVSPTGDGGGEPTGDVTFFADGDQIGDPVPVGSNGSATSDAVGLAAGTHQIVATYSGDTNFAGSTKTIEQEVNAAQTHTAVSTSPNPSVFGQPVTAHAVVTPVSPATGHPAGAVKFVVDGEDEYYANIEDGAADATITGLAVGDHSIVATYLSGDPNFVTSTSPEASHQVNKAATSTEVTSSSPTSVWGQPVTFTATISVDSPGAGSPSGTVTFTDGSTVLGSAPVSSSTGEQASIVVDTLSVAQHQIVATYSGDDSFLESDGSVAQKVNRAQTSTLVTSSANPAASGEPISFTAHVSPVAPGAGHPLGTVVFTVNGAQLGNAVMVDSDGNATSEAFATLTPGTYTIAATYSGDGHFVGSTGGLDQGAGLNVVKGASSLTLESSDPAAGYGAPVTFTATAKAVAPATGRPSGVVRFWEGNKLLGASNLAAAEASGTSTAQFVTSTLSPGAHSIRAEYVGNFNFEGATASTSQDIGPSGTVTGISATPNPASFGQDVTLKATVAGAPGTPGEPTGTVTFRDGSTVLGTVTLDGDQHATLEVSGLHGGQHVLTAQYSGGGLFDASTSADYTLTVQRAASSIHAERLTSFTGGEANVRIGVVKAVLTGLDGEPLQGETIVFTTHEPGPNGAVLPVCQAVTNERGAASCQSALPHTVLVLLGQGYEATFEGNADYQPSTDHGNEFATDEVNP
ncbi:Ig-like domain-containing protein [Aeromicrobium terrae]|uniref:Ig-like domain-containing protein n=1 Tax=Aeromicrobium terrae TaxID=2498846 RepID=UPI001650B014|nr:Ig-like domain-containing protein [Aeromicrobium terrae]